MHIRFKLTEFLQYQISSNLIRKASGNLNLAGSFLYGRWRRGFFFFLLSAQLDSITAAVRGRNRHPVKGF